MADNGQDEATPLLRAENAQERRTSQIDEEASSIINSHVSIGEQKMGESTIGERLPYPNYSTIDWLHDLVRCQTNVRGFDHVTNNIRRSKTHIDFEIFTVVPVFATRS